MLGRAPGSESKWLSNGRVPNTHPCVAWGKSLPSLGLCSQLKNEAGDKGVGPPEFSQAVLL